MTTSQNNPVWPAIIAFIGGLILLIPVDDISQMVRPGSDKPATALSREIDEVAPEGSEEDLLCMSRAIRQLANTVATNPSIRQSEGIDDDPGSWLKKTLELSYAEGFVFATRYPRVKKVVEDWYLRNIQDGMTANDLTNKWHELADALE